MRHARGIIALLAVVSLSACSDDSTEPSDTTGTIVLQFEHVVSDEPLEMNTGSYTNAAGNSYSVTKLEYTVSEFVVSGASQNVSSPGIHYRNALDASTATLTLGSAPAGTYTTLQFRHGIAAAENQAGTLPDLDTAGMAWPPAMGGGYHYMRNEGSFTMSGGGVGNFTTHTGPTMGNDYSFVVTLTLPSGAEVRAGETLTIRLEMDVNEWYTGPNTWDFNDYGLIMGNMGAQTTLNENGASVWAAAEVN